MSLLAKIKTGSGLSVYLKGRKPFTMPYNHKLFTNFEAAVNVKDVQEILNIINIAENTSRYMDGKVQILDGEVFFGPDKVHNVVAQKILELQAAGEDHSFMVKFLENLMLNPSKTSIDELYLFLEANNMPITEDGRFIAYKWVKDDYWDVHTGSTNRHFDDTTGKAGGVFSMPRSAVDDNRHRTCSSGLHVCSPGYDKFGERLLLVAVNPADVVSVPHDYNNSKMRVSEYEVVEEVVVESYGQHKQSIYRRA